MIVPLLFVATIADKNQVKQQIVVARYGYRIASSEFIARRLLELPAALYEYGFIVRHIDCDGATEIRAALHLIGNITAKEVLSNTFTAEELRGLPLSFIVGYKHPSVGCEDVTILFGGDMPHWIKKFRNAFDNKSRQLMYRRKRMKLANLKYIWEVTESSGSNLRRTRFTYDFFELDSYKKMRDWKKECGGYTKQFITWQSHEDLRWLVFGIVGYAALYLKNDCSLVVDQGRFGSDTMEHLFALIRAGNSNPTNQQANEGLSKVGANNAVLEANMFRTKGTNTGGAQVGVESYVADTIQTKSQRQKRKRTTND